MRSLFVLLAASSALAGVLVASSEARAQEPPPPPSTSATSTPPLATPGTTTTGGTTTEATTVAGVTQGEPLPSVGITISPLHLILPVVELTVEPRLTNKISVAAIVGYGSIKQDVLFESFRFKVYELGGQFRYYVLGDYRHGMQLGAELLYIKVSTDGNSTGTIKVSGIGEGLAAGPFVGYKIATRVGFTFDAQLGAEFAVVRAHASDSSSSASNSDSKVFPLLNLNVGWSF